MGRSLFELLEPRCLMSAAPHADAGNTLNKALNLGLFARRTVHHTETVGASDAADYFKFTTTGNTRLTISLKTPIQFGHLALLDSVGDVLATTPGSRLMPNIGAGVWYVEVTASLSSVRYNLTLQSTPLSAKAKPKFVSPALLISNTRLPTFPAGFAVFANSQTQFSTASDRTITANIPITFSDPAYLNLAGISTINSVVKIGPGALSGTTGLIATNPGSGSVLVTGGNGSVIFPGGGGGAITIPNPGTGTGTPVDPSTISPGNPLNINTGDVTLSSGTLTLSPGATVGGTTIPAGDNVTLSAVTVSFASSSITVNSTARLILPATVSPALASLATAITIDPQTKTYISFPDFFVTAPILINAVTGDLSLRRRHPLPQHRTFRHPQSHLHRPRRHDSDQGRPHYPHRLYQQRLRLRLHRRNHRPLYSHHNHRPRHRRLWRYPH